MKLKEFMTMHGLTLRVLAEATGLTKPTINSYAEGIRQPSVDNAFKIQKATLGIVKIDDFLLENRDKKEG